MSPDKRAKILLVTELYPHRQDQTNADISFALHYFVRHWRAQEGIDVRVVVPVPYNYREPWTLPPALETTTRDGVEVAGIRLWRVPHTTWVVTMAPVHRYLDAVGFRPDVVVSHMPTGTHNALRLNRCWRRPHVAGIHGSDVARMRLGEDCYKRVDGVAYRSQRLQRDARALLELPEGFVAESGVEAELLRPPEQVLARELHRPLRLVTISTLVENKQLDAVMEALAGLPANRPWEYRIYGTGPCRPKLERRAAELGITDRVRFHGHQPREVCFEALDWADVYVMISLTETFGLTYLEAMACGALVIASRGTGIDGLVKHGENGFLCGPGDATELRSLLQDLPEMDLQDLRRAAQDTIRRYTQRERAQAYLDYILSFLAD